MSGKRYVIADLHLGHIKMAKYRGFETVEEHDEYIIKCWNSVIKKKDVVYILGDLTMEKKQPYVLLDRLNGFKKVVLGNHDMPQHIPYLLNHVNKVSSSLKLKNAILTHIPIHPSELDRFGVNIHGHLHEKSIEKSEVIDSNGLIIHKRVKDIRYFCVSCEQLNYTPILLDEILDKKN